MKYTIITILAALTVACGNAGQPVRNSNSAAASPPEKSQTAISHTLEKQTPPADPASGGKSKWTQSGEPIDTKEFDASIAAAEKALAAKPNDEAAQKALSAAYFKRADALTGARQYASALGDYRTAVKHDPTNADAKQWIDQIISIYSSIGRDYPKEGEEPPPLPAKQ